MPVIVMRNVPSTFGLVLTDLTEGEALTLERRRVDQSQTEVADRLGVPRYRYVRMETDKLSAKDEGIEVQAPYPLPTESEICFLLRRRGNWDQESCAAEMGVSRTWFATMERGRSHAKPLIDYWLSCQAAR